MFWHKGIGWTFPALEGAVANEINIMEKKSNTEHQDNKKDVWRETQEQVKPNPS